MSDVPWRRYEQMVDAAVDHFWYEPVELHPYFVDPMTSQPTADATRNIKKTIGVMMRHGAAVTGEGAVMGGSINARQVSSDVWLSISEINLQGSIADWQPGDRVYFPNRALHNEPPWYEINWPAPSATGRWDIHLTVLEPGA
jgi:hypothetical protein